MNASTLENGAIHVNGNSKVKPTILKNWTLRTLADAYQPREPMKYLVEGLIPIPSLSIVYGAPGSLKSMLLADLALCVAGGKKFLDRINVLTETHGQTFATKQAGVLWVDFDNGRRRSDERFDAVGRGHSLGANTPLYYVSMPDPPLDASNRAFVGALVDLVRQTGVQMVVIDNLGLVCGQVDENSAEMARVMGNLRYLAEEAVIAVIVVHHQRKSGSVDGRKGETLRGHSSIEAALDLALLVERTEGTDDITVTPTKSRGFVVKPFGANFTWEHKPGTHDLQSARFWSEAILSVQDRERMEIETAILAAVDAGPLSQGDLRAAVRSDLIVKNGRAPGEHKITALADAMVKNGLLTTKKGEKNAKLYAAL